MQDLFSNRKIIGEVPERLIGAVSKTVVCQWWTGGSNPPLSAVFYPEFDDKNWWPEQIL
jgi:hypothetical protein